jgi:hypothetical protein
MAEVFGELAVEVGIDDGARMAGVDGQFRFGTVGCETDGGGESGGREGLEEFYHEGTKGEGDVRGRKTERLEERRGSE